MKCVLLLCLLSVPALAAIGPTTPPPGWSGTSAEWGEIWKRADHFSKEASKLVKGANQQCIRGVMLRVLGYIEAQVSGDAVKGEPDVRMTVHPKDRQKFDDALKRNRDDSCGPPGGSSMGDTVEAMARLATKVDDWAYANYKGRALTRADLGEGLGYLYDRARPKLAPSTPWVVEMLKLGIFVPAVEGAKAAAAGATLPILNPRLFMKREVDPSETL